MHRAYDVLRQTCPSRGSLARIATKWTALIVLALGDDRLRFGELRSTVEGISPKVLTETLRSLERDGILTRHEFDEMPPRVEYELTALGHTLLGPIHALTSWAEAYAEEVEAARDRFDDKILLGSGPAGLQSP
ncbi:helix-turn-helix domain-containing protein [Mariniluteicoccus endophyticus]